MEMVGKMKKTKRINGYVFLRYGDANEWTMKKEKAEKDREKKERWNC